jgi:hypothetical protein
VSSSDADAFPVRIEMNSRRVFSSAFSIPERASLMMLWMVIN